jgi:hypothetical protein
MLAHGLLAYAGRRSRCIKEALVVWPDTRPDHDASANNCTTPPSTLNHSSPIIPKSSPQSKPKPKALPQAVSAYSRRPRLASIVIMSQLYAV